MTLVRIREQDFEENGIPVTYNSVMKWKKKNTHPGLIVNKGGLDYIIKEKFDELVRDEKIRIYKRPADKLKITKEGNKTIVPLNRYTFKEAGIKIRLSVFYRRTCRRKFSNMYVMRDNHLCIIKEELDKLMAGGFITEDGVTHRKESERRHRMSGETYRIALEVGKMQGKTDAQVWKELHAIEKKHGLRDEEYEEDVTKGNENYKR